MLKPISLLFILLFSFGCIHPEKPSDSGDLLAEIDKLSVTEAHFKAAFQRYYYRVGESLVPSVENKRSVLNEEFETLVLATYAKDEGLADDDRSTLEYGLLVRKVFAEEYLQQAVLDHIYVTEQDLRELFLRYNTTMRASHLYAADKESADLLYEKLMQGEQFEDLAQEVFSNSYLAQSGGDLGEFTVDEMDIAFENSAFELKIGEISKPVKTRQGYSIIKLTDKFTTPILTEFQYASQKNFLESFAKKRLDELATRKHIAEIVAQLGINDDKVQELWLDITEVSRQPLSHNFENQVLRFSSKFADNTELAGVGDFSFTIQDLKTEGFYSPIGYFQRIQTLSDFRDFVQGLIYRTYIIEAFKNSEQFEDPRIQQSIDHSFHTYLQKRAIEHVSDNLKFSEEELRAEFLANKSMYDYPLMMNVSRIVVGSKEEGVNVVKAVNDGLDWVTAVRTYTQKNQDLMVDGVLGIKPINEYGTHAFALKDLNEGDVVGPLDYQTNQFVVYKVIEIQEPHSAEFEEVKTLVKEVLTRNKLEPQLKLVVQNTMQKHNAVVYNEKLQSIKIEL